MEEEDKTENDREKEDHPDVTLVQSSRIDRIDTSIVREDLKMRYRGNSEGEDEDEEEESSSEAKIMRMIDLSDFIVLELLRMQR